MKRRQAPQYDQSAERCSARKELCARLDFDWKLREDCEEHDPEEVRIPLHGGSTNVVEQTLAATPVRRVAKADIRVVHGDIEHGDQHRKEDRDQWNKEESVADRSIE